MLGWPAFWFATAFVLVMSFLMLLDINPKYRFEDIRGGKPEGWPAEHFSREDQRDAQTVAQVHHRPQAGMVFHCYLF
jgi:hypothetical protein